MSLVCRWRDVCLGESGVRRRKRNVSQKGEGLKSEASTLEGEDLGSEGLGKGFQVIGRKEHRGSSGKS